MCSPYPTPGPSCRFVSFAGGLALFPPSMVKVSAVGGRIFWCVPLAPSAVCRCSLARKTPRKIKPEVWIAIVSPSEVSVAWSEVLSALSLPGC